MTTMTTSSWQPSPPQLAVVALLLLLLSSCCLAETALGTINNNANNSSYSSSSSSYYGVDVSFPIHHSEILDKQQEHESLLGDRQAFYDKYIHGCREYYQQHYQESMNVCDESEQYRIATNLHQPSHSRNYTTIGYKKMRAPKELYELVHNFFIENKDHQQREVFDPNQIYSVTRCNHWTSPTYMVSLYDSSLIERSLGNDMRNQIWQATESILREWTGYKVDLRPTSIYGIRVCTKGAVLSPHVDRQGLVLSAIINVDQSNLEQPWPLEVYGRNGMAHNITMEPGDLVLYESHSTIHGRPFPLEGDYYANIFIHFEPIIEEEDDDDDDDSVVEDKEDEL